MGNWSQLQRSEVGTNSLSQSYIHFPWHWLIQSLAENKSVSLGKETLLLIKKATGSKCTIFFSLALEMSNEYGYPCCFWFSCYNHMRNQWYNGANMLGGRTDTKKDIGHWEHCWFLEYLLLATKSILFGRRENFVELGEEKIMRKW